MEQQKFKKLESFFQKFSTKTFKKGTLIQTSGSNTGFVYFIINGFVGMYDITKESQKLFIDIQAPNTAFPVVTAIQNDPPKYYYEALTDVEVYEAPAKKVSSFIKNDIETLNAINESVIKAFYKLANRVEQLSYDSSKVRIASLLTYFATHFATDNNGEYRITIEFSHKEIAAFAGITRETASRVLKSLEKSKIIKYKYKKITVLNLDKLSKIVR